MQIRPKITFEEYLATHRAILAVKPKSGQLRSWWYYPVLLVTALAFGIAAQFPPTRIPALSIFAGMIIYAAIVTALAKRSRDKRMRRIFAEEEFALNDQVLTIDQSGISYVRGNGQATSHHRWDAFLYSTEMPDAIVFLPTPNTFIRVPKQHLSAADDQSIREWSAGIPKKSLS
ncbi:MAG TPA: hypothetical protein VGJ21_24475 [Terracidiphilus sp.]|jgi:hypothetical protein